MFRKGNDPVEIGTSREEHRRRTGNRGISRFYRPGSDLFLKRSFQERSGLPSKRDNLPRIRILNTAEQACFEHPPVFDSAERKRHFDFSQSVMRVARGLRGSANRIGFLLAYGYFRASRRFFSPERFHERDIRFVSRALDLPLDTFTPESYIDMTQLRHQKRILDLLGFRPFGDQAKSHLTPKLRQWRVRISSPGSSLGVASTS